MMDNLRYETASYILDLLEEIILLARGSGVAGVRSDGVYPVLRALDNGCVNRPSQIAEELSVAPPTMSVRLNEMYDQGLIMKFTDRKDARSHFVEITRKGQELLESEKNRRRIELSLSNKGLDTLESTYSDWIDDFSILDELGDDKLQAFYETQQEMIDLLKKRRVSDESNETK